MRDDNDDFLCNAADDIMTGLKAGFIYCAIAYAILMLVGPALMTISARSVVGWIFG